ncbi:MAG: cysteine desulfurase family protein [Bdellovibrionota bacterium]
MSTTLTGTIYFDNAATTPPLACVAEKLHELTISVTGNSSSLHRKGRQAQEVLDSAQEALGRHFNVPPSHVVFTSGGTESNNLAIWGALGGLTSAFHWLKSGGQGKLITSSVEHTATSAVFDSLECMGAQVCWIGVDQQGLLDLSQLETELESRVRLISLHHAQNEIGSVQDIRAISQLMRAKQPDALLHIDAVQSFMKVPLSLDELGADMASVSSHKIGGPKGIGALILGRRFENRNPKIGCLIQGSSQQSGMRPGTVPVPAVGAFMTAVEWGMKNFMLNKQKLLILRERLLSTLPKKAVLNGPNDTSNASPNRVPQTVNFSIPGLPSAVTVEALSARGICISAGAACHSTNPKPNATLMQMGVGRERALSTVRVSFSHDNTLEQVDAFVSTLNEVIEQYL